MDKKDINILYVEDDLDLQEAMSHALKTQYKNIYTASNSQEGLELYEKHMPDIIISDIKMPIMDGVEMVKSIKKLSGNPSIIFVSAFNESDMILKISDVKIDLYLLKPLKLDQLFSEINNIHSRKHTTNLYQSLDTDGKILDVNQVWLDYMGYQRDEVLGKFFGNFVSIDSMENLKKNFPHLRSYGYVNNVRFKLKHKDGHLLDAVLNGTATYNTDGSFKCTHCELRNLDFFMLSQAEISELLHQERYLKGLISTHVRISNTVLNVLTEKLFLDAVVNAFVENIEYEFAFVSLEDENQKLKIEAQSNHPSLNLISEIGDFIDQERCKECPTFTSFHTNKAIIVDDITKLPDFTLKELYEKEGVNGIVSIPLKEKNAKIIGVLTLLFKLAHRFGPEEIQLFKGLADTITFGLQVIEEGKEKEILLEKLAVQATTDTLTSCINRNHGYKVLEEELTRSIRYKRELSIIFFDIDDFKDVNDNYGHEAGDKLLVEISETVRNNLRSSDLCIRWGGEEFVIFLPETNLKNAAEFAEKIQRLFNGISISENKSTSASFGVAQFMENESLDAFVSRSDLLMYQAKKAGKNRVMF